MSLVMDDERVEGTVDGGALLDDWTFMVDALLRPRTLREKEGKLRSSLWVTL